MVEDSDRDSAIEGPEVLLAKIGDARDLEPRALTAITSGVRNIVLVEIDTDVVDTRQVVRQSPYPQPTSRRRWPAWACTY